MDSNIFASKRETLIQLRSFSPLREGKLVKEHNDSTEVEQSHGASYMLMCKEQTSDLSEVDVRNDLLQTQKLV